MQARIFLKRIQQSQCRTWAKENVQISEWGPYFQEETWVRRASKHAKRRRPLIDKESEGMVEDITP